MAQEVMWNQWIRKKDAFFIHLSGNGKPNRRMVLSCRTHVRSWGMPGQNQIRQRPVLDCCRGTPLIAFSLWRSHLWRLFSRFENQVKNPYQQNKGKESHETKYQEEWGIHF